MAWYFLTIAGRGLLSTAEDSLKAELNLPQKYSDLATRMHLWASTSLLSSHSFVLSCSSGRCL